MNSEDVCPAITLGVAGGWAAAALFPYLLTLSPGLLERHRRPLWLLVLTQSLQAAIVLSLIAWAGLRFGMPLGLDALLIRALCGSLTHPAWPDWISAGWAIAALAGSITGLLILLADRFFFLPSLPPTALRPLPGAAPWKALLAGFYGAIVEEILSRLFAMSAISWLLLQSGAFNRGQALTAGCLAAALLFAAGHLPAARQFAPLTRPAVARVMTLNTAAGLVFGVLYWRYGLEAAMIAHFAADLVLHVLTALR